MNFFDFFRKKQVSETKASNGSFFMYGGVGSTVYRKDSYHDLADEGYGQNSIVYRCVNEIANSSSAVKIIVTENGTKIDRGLIIDLLNRPNPLQSGVEFFQSLISFLLISGNAYVLKSGMDKSVPRELHLLRPDRIKIIPNEYNVVPMRYDYMLEGRVKESYPIDNETGYSSVKHMKLWNPLNDYYGMSPLSASASDVDQHNLAGRHNVNLLVNGARPTGAVVFNPRDIKSGIPLQLNDDQRQQILHDLDLRFTGAQNAGRTMLLEGDFDWKEMGMTPKDMDFIELKNMSAKDIALCFGVPGQLVGVTGSQTYSNVAEARLALYEETIIPLLQRLEGDFNEWLFPLFGNDVKMQYDIDSIPAMSERRKKIYENVSMGVREGIISRNEARARLGFDPVENGDSLYISSAFDPIADTEGRDVRREQESDGDDQIDNEVVEGSDGDIDEDSKAESDVDTKPTESMAQQAQIGLKEN